MVADAHFGVSTTNPMNIFQQFPVDTRLFDPRYSGAVFNRIQRENSLSRSSQEVSPRIYGEAALVAESCSYLGYRLRTDGFRGAQ
jgi:hypothetical protein